MKISKINEVYLELEVDEDVKVTQHASDVVHKGSVHGVVYKGAGTPGPRGRRRVGGHHPLEV